MSESTLAAVARAAAEQTAPTGNQPSATTQPVASAPPAPATPDTAALAAARQEGVQAERSRAKAILTCEAAKDRGDLAHYFAFDTDMTAEQAVAALDRAPKAAAQEPNDFLAAMRSEPNPNVGTGAATAAPPNAPTMTLAERAAARHGVPANAAR